MQPVIRRSKSAQRDYIDIWNWIAKDNPAAADELLRKIDEKLNPYAAVPFAGSPRDDVLPGMRSFVVGKYVVFYRPEDGGIEVARVLHGARNFNALFEKDH